MEIYILTFTIVFLLPVDSFLCSSAIPEFEYINKSVDPCENFYEYTCGNFKNVKPRPTDEPLWDHFVILQKELEELFKFILSEPNTYDDTTALKKAKAAYMACMEVDYADQLNVPEVAILEEKQAWPLIAREPVSEEVKWSDIANMAAEFGVPLFFDVYVQPDILNATQVSIMIDADEISKETDNVGIRPEFSENIQNFLSSKYSRESEMDSPYLKYIYRIALHLRNKIGSHRDETLIKRDIEGVIEFMNKFQDESEKSGPMQILTVKGLQQWTEDVVGKQLNINWLDYLNGLFRKAGVEIHPETEITIQRNESLKGVLELMNGSSDELLLNFVMTRLFTQTAQDSNGELRRAYEQFRKDMGDKSYARDDYCVRYVLGYPEAIALSMAATHEYQLHYFNVNKLQKARKMVENLMKSFTEIVETSDWLDAPSQLEVLKKADKMAILLGYPKFIEDPVMVNKYYENLRVCAWDHFGNSQRLKAFKRASNLALFANPNFRYVWSLSPLYVNAFYNLQQNTILFPVSMLNGVFFNGTNSALDYGRIGAVIGHEITHGFDNIGKDFDSDGSITFEGLWTPETEEKFTERSTCFKNQYSEYFIPELNRTVNGQASLRENIADNGGLRQAYKALKDLQRRGFLNQHVGGYTPEQLFFVGYGTMWCATETKEYLDKLSTYPPSRYRLIGAVSNNKEFAKAFSCPLGSKMNPIDKCVIW